MPKNNRKNYHPSEKTRKKISESLKGKMLGNKNPSKRPEVREKIRKKALKRFKDKKFREMHKKSCKDYYKNHNHHTKGIPKSKLQKEKMSKARKKWYKNNPIKAKRKNEKSRLTNIRKGTHKGNKNSNWYNGISKQRIKRYTSNELKEEIKKRDGFRCQQCFRHKKELIKPLVIHHIDFNRQNDKENNLITLCNSCHSQLSYNRKNWIKYFKEVMIERRCI